MPIQLTPIKVCSLCKVPKLRVEFTRRFSGNYEARCKLCRNNVRKAKYALDITLRLRHAQVATAWQKQNKERHNVSCSKWNKANRVASTAATHRYRARKALNGGSYTVAQWLDLKTKYNNICLCCKATDVKLTVDHVVPLSKGGVNTIDNIQPLCKSCNSGKKDNIVDYRGSLL